VNEIQSACVDAVQEHSRSMEMDTEPVPPAGVKLDV